jgi:hypothetical protein
MTDRVINISRHDYLAATAATPEAGKKLPGSGPGYWQYFSAGS